jgi:hypothetical protein
MPLVGQDDLIGQIGIDTDVRNLVKLDQVTESDDSILDITKAAFSQENIIGSALVKNDLIEDVEVDESGALSRPLVPGFRFEDHIPPGYEAYAEMYAFTNNEDETKKVTQFIERRLEEQSILRRNGAAGIGAAMAAGILDPTILIPGVGALKGAKAAKIAKGALIGSATAGAAVSLQEASLQATQGDTRPIELSQGAILSAMMLGGIVGGGIGAMSKGVRSGATAAIDDALSDSPASIRVRPDGKLSAESVALQKNAEGLANLNENIAKLASGPEITRSISLRGVTAEFGTVRKVTNDLFDHNFIVGKELAGEARGEVFERALSVDQGKVIRLNSELRDAYKGYVGIPSDLGAFAKAKMQGKLSFSEFDQEIGKAMRRGDVHRIPQVQQAAQKLRKLMDEKATRLQELGLLGDDLDPKTASSYFMRRYRTGDIVENYDEFKGIVTDWLKEVNPGKSLEEIDDIAVNTIDNILGMGDQSLAMSDMATRMSQGSAKFTKERVFQIPDARIERFLDNRGSVVGSQYISQADSMIRLQEMLQRNGWDSVNDARKALRDEFQVRIDAATDPAERARLNKSLKKELDLMNNMFKISLGHFGTESGADSALRTLRKYQTYRLLGGVTLSSVPDMAMPVFKHGLPRTILDGYGTMARNLKASKLAKDQLKDFGIGLELEQNTLLRNLTDPDFKLGVRQSKLERAADSLSETFGKVTLMTYWNNMHKRIAGHMSSARTLRALSKTVLDEKEALRLRQLGIDEAMGKRINAQFKKYGEIQDGSYIGNYHKWTDKDAKKVFGQATLSDVDSTILTPSRGDLPEAALASELGKTIFQFKSFSSTATNKLLISGVQRRDAEMLQGLIGLVGMGAFTYTLKERIAGRTPEDDIDKLLIEGINRSGVTGLFGDYVMGLSNAFLGTQANSRYAGRSIEGLFLGPSADIVKDLGQAAVNATDGELTEADANKLRRMTPFNNVFYLRMLMNKLQEDED